MEKQYSHVLSNIKQTIINPTLTILYRDSQKLGVMEKNVFRQNIWQILKRFHLRSTNQKIAKVPSNNCNYLLGSQPKRMRDLKVVIWSYVLMKGLPYYNIVRHGSNKDDLFIHKGLKFSSLYFLLHGKEVQWLVGCRIRKQGRESMRP